ncbi:MAG: hypothetical protein HYT16_03425 [DPANN group archaeon]|nr:hypothetical protein [DPANN group archaeon]
MAAGKVRVGKKKWFTVLAPEVFGKNELVEITAYEPNELLSKPVELNFAQISGNPKDQSKKIILKLIETQGDRALTEPWRFYLQDSFVGRTGRRYKEKFHYVARSVSKDKKNVIVKIYVMTSKKLHQSARADIIRIIDSKTKAFLTNVDAFDFFRQDVMENLAGELRKDIRKVYPVDKVFIWKVAVNPGKRTK